MDIFWIEIGLKMFKVKIIFILIVSLFDSILSETLEVKSYILAEIKFGNMIAEKNKNHRLAIASIAKLFSAYYSVQKISADSKIIILDTSPNESIINPKAAKFQKGEVYNLQEILHAMLMTSSNIASVSLASKLNGNEKKFTETANDFFLKDGFLKTHLEDAHGLSEKTESSSEEILKLLKLIHKEKIIFDILKKKDYILSNEKKNQRIQTTVEMTQYKGFTIFGKTGSTKKAGKCFAGYMEKQNHLYAIVLLNSGNIYSDIKILLDQFLTE